MQKLSFVFLLSVALLSCDIRNQHTVDVKASPITDEQLAEKTSVEVIDTLYNFGKATDGEKVEYNFKFRNSGTKPLIISNATSSCGCTVPEKPEAPVKPGEIGFLKVVFDSKNRVGTVHKDIKVISNAEPAFPTLQLTGEVVPKS
ncbi:MAG: DUF1573 domain-containing protein [Ginsengibacter sp.]